METILKTKANTIGRANAVERYIDIATNFMSNISLVSETYKKIAKLQSKAVSSDDENEIIETLEKIKTIYRGVK